MIPPHRLVALLAHIAHQLVDRSAPLSNVLPCVCQVFLHLCLAVGKFLQGRLQAVPPVTAIAAKTLGWHTWKTTGSSDTAVARARCCACRAPISREWSSSSAAVLAVERPILSTRCFKSCNHCSWLARAQEADVLRSTRCSRCGRPGCSHAFILLRIPRLVFVPCSGRWRCDVDFRLKTRHPEN